MAACTVDSEDGQMTFGPTTNPTSFTTTMTATTAEPSSSTTDDVSTSGGSDPSTSGDDVDADSDSAGTSAASTAEDTGASEQPDDGMYSHCTDVMDCFSQNTCVVVEPGDGFCSTYPCADAASCDASPGGTAAPICAEVTVPTGMSTACALDCSGGETCPGGMICAALGTGMVCT
jgi:hypothetical protein